MKINPEGVPVSHPAPRRTIGHTLKRIAIGAFIALAVLFTLAVACSPTPTTPTGSPSLSTPSTDSPASPATAPPATEQAPVAPTFGTAVDSDGVQITPTAPKAVKDVIGSYFCTTVTYVNGSDSPIDYNAFQWKLTDSEGVETAPTFGGTKKYLGTGNVNPGGKKSGDICFDKGEGTPTSLSFQGGLFDGTTTWTK